MSKGHKIGTGGALLGVAKLYFLVASYATVLVLTRVLDPATFGSYSAVGRLIAVPNMVIIYTLMFTVSRPMAVEFSDGNPGYHAIRKRGFKMAALLGGSVSLVFFFGAPMFAAGLSDESLTWPIRVVAPISLVYAFYAVNVGTINARRFFTRQAGLDILMATAKASLIIAAAALGLGLASTLGGFTLASVVAFVVSLWWVRATRPEDGTQTSAAPMAELAGVLIVFTTATNLLLSTDLFVLKHFATDEAAKGAVGFYSGAQYIAQVPYSLLNAVSLLMFPLIASLHAQGNDARVRTYVTQTMKVTVLLLALMASVAAAAAPGIMRLLFPPEYGAVAEDLRLIVVGYSGYSLVVTAAWILNSSQRPRSALMLVLVSLILSACGSYFLAPERGTHGVAIAVLAAGLSGAAAALFALYRHFKAALPALWVAKIVVAVTAVAGIGFAWEPTGKLMVLVQLTALTLAFGAVVFLSRAVTVSEIKELRKRD